MAEIVKQALMLVNYALENYVDDYVYILEDLQKILTGRMILLPEDLEKY